MLDLAYAVGTVAFFMLMLAYARACERLGRSATDAPERQP